MATVSGQQAFPGAFAVSYRMFQGVRLLQWSAEKSLCRGLGAMLLRHAESDVVPSFVSTALVLSDNRRETLSARLQQALKAAAAELKAAQALAAAELAAAHDTAADWEDRALDAELELQGCRAQDKAWQEVERLECALERQAAAVTVAEQRAQQAEEALLLEQTAHKHTSQQLNQAQQLAAPRIRSSSKRRADRYAAGFEAAFASYSTGIAALKQASEKKEAPKQEEARMKQAVPEAKKAPCAGAGQDEWIPAFWPAALSAQPPAPRPKNRVVQLLCC